MRRIWLSWAVTLAACVDPPAPDVVATDAATEAAVGMDAADAADTGSTCMSCVDPRCRGCSGGCCLSFDDVAPREAATDAPREAATDGSPDVPATDVPPTCPGGQTFCAGAGCVDLARDPNHCTTCGNACTGMALRDAGIVDMCLPADLDAGAPAGCRAACETPGLTLCHDGAGSSLRYFCVNTQVASDNCGACGRACAPGLFCRAGACS